MDTTMTTKQRQSQQWWQAIVGGVVPLLLIVSQAMTIDISRESHLGMSHPHLHHRTGIRRNQDIPEAQQESGIGIASVSAVAIANTDSSLRRSRRIKAPWECSGLCKNRVVLWRRALPRVQRAMLRSAPAISLAVWGRGILSEAPNWFQQVKALSICIWMRCHCLFASGADEYCNRGLYCSSFFCICLS